MKIGIYGYGNVGKGVDLAIKQNNDMELVGVFTKRDNVKSVTGAKVYKIDELTNFTNDIDVLIICSGSATELPVTTPELAKSFNVVDSFDTHAKILEHYKNVDKVAKENNHIAFISGGWDPGMFSLMRLYASVILPNSNTYTFWGNGISQGHSDALRHIEGVKDARQYTVPIDEAVKKVEDGLNPTLSQNEKHKRVCFVVLEEGADKNKIENEIKNMPNYFLGFDVEINFITQDELNKNHSGFPHAGLVASTGSTGLSNEHKHMIEYKLKLDSNPEFTANILVSFARAIYKMKNEGQVGCKTAFDIRPKDMSCLDYEEVLKML